MPFPLLSRLFAPREASDGFRPAATLALAQAVFSGDVAELNAAICPQANLNAVIMPPHVTTARTLLQHAILSDQPAVVQALLRAGADPMLATPQVFWPAAHLATLLEQRASIVYLIADGRAQFDLQVMDPLVGEPSDCCDIAARRLKGFADWFGQYFSLVEAARPPVFEEEPIVVSSSLRPSRPRSM